MKNPSFFLIILFLTTVPAESADPLGKTLQDLQKRTLSGKILKRMGLRAYRQGEYEKALTSFKRLAERGDAEAQRIVGNIYLDGRAVPQDFVAAMKWYQKAAHQRDPASQYKLGLMHEKGWGVQPDLIIAHMWYNLAASGSTGADREDFSLARDLIAERMTTEQINKAQQLAREWKPENLEQPLK